MAPRSRRRLSPIGTLPTELLSTVLWFSLQLDDRKYTPIKQLSRLRMVCKHWKSVIDASPALETDIYLEDSSRAVTRALKRSSNHAINVSGDEWTPMQEEVFLQLCTVISRWKDVSFPELGEPFYRQLESPAPLVRDCSLGYRGWEEQESPVDLFSGQAPHLRRLLITRLQIQWNTPIFQGLKLLSLSRVTITNSEIIRIVGNSPTLEQLALRELEVPDVKDQSEDSVEVTHQCLRFLQIQIVPLSTAHALFNNLILPICRSLFFSQWRSGICDTTIFKTRFFRCLPNVLSPDIGLKIRCEDRRLDVTSDGLGSKSHNFSLDTGKPGEFWSFLDWLASHVNARIISIELRGSCHLDDTLGTLLPRLQHLESLTFVKCQDAAALVNMLSPRSDGDGSWTWPLPNLTTLKFEECDNSIVASSLVSMLNERGIEHQETPHSTFVKVQHLALTGDLPSGKVIQQLNEAMGPRALLDIESLETKSRHQESGSLYALTLSLE